MPDQIVLLSVHSVFLRMSVPENQIREFGAEFTDDQHAHVGGLAIVYQDGFVVLEYTANDQTQKSVVRMHPVIARAIGDLAALNYQPHSRTAVLDRLLHLDRNGRIGKNTEDEEREFRVLYERLSRPTGVADPSFVAAHEERVAGHLVREVQDG